MGYTPEARDKVIRTILGEAGGEDPASMAAVANVIRNRALSGVWGDAYHGGLTRAITAPKQFASQAPGSGNFSQRISSNDPAYQRAGAIADQVFNNQVADNTGGATHFYANKGPNATAAPDWATGQQGQQFGNQIFFKLPLTASNTAGSGVTGPSSVGQTGATGELPNGGNTKQDPGVDIRHIDPVFMARINQLRADAAAAGIQTHIVSGYRDNVNQAGLYQKHLAGGPLAAAPGESYHNFGRAVDIITDDPKQQSALTALAAQPWRNIRPGATFGDYDHYEAVEGRTAALTEPGHVAVPVGRPSEVPHPDASSSTTPSGQGGIGSDAAAVSRVINPNVPAAQAQPVSAAAPPGQTDPNARFQVLQTMGRGGRPGLPYTALNLAPGVGSTPPAAAAAAPPAAPAAPAAAPTLQPSSPDLAALNRGLTYTGQSFGGAEPIMPPRTPTPPINAASSNMPYPGQIDPTGNWAPPPGQASTNAQPPFQTSLSNPVQAWLSRLFQTG